MPLAHGAGWLVWFLTLPGFAKTPDVRFEPHRGPIAAQAAVPTPPIAKAGTSGREFFVSWGYNGDSYAKSDMHISQPSLANDFALVGVQARDSRAWTSLFRHSLFVPQYNIRAGVFFNEKWGIEVALDHMKWIVRQDQEVRMTGMMNGSARDTEVMLTPDVLRYQLNNGANPIFFNMVRRMRLAGEPGRTGHVSLLAKAGGGFAVPHTENVLFGQPNDKGFQFFHGWDVDAGAAVRAHILRRLYFEFEEKVVYARYFGVKIDRGTARHSLKANEFTFNFGVAFR
jgi:hypothetical protein